MLKCTNSIIWAYIIRTKLCLRQTVLLFKEKNQPCIDLKRTRLFHLNMENILYHLELLIGRFGQHCLLYIVINMVRSLKTNDISKFIHGYSRERYGNRQGGKE